MNFMKFFIFCAPLFHTKVTFTRHRTKGFYEIRRNRKDVLPKQCWNSCRKCIKYPLDHSIVPGFLQERAKGDEPTIEFRRRGDAPMIENRRRVMLMKRSNARTKPTKAAGGVALHQILSFVCCAVWRVQAPQNRSDPDFQT